jgi:hypothetical protein
MAEINADAVSKIIKCSQSLVNALQLHEQSLQPGMKPKDPVFISLLARFEESYTAFINAIASEEPREQIEIKRVQLLEQVDQANMDMFAMLRQREDEIDELLHGLLPYPSQEQQVIPND